MSSKVRLHAALPTRLSLAAALVLALAGLVAFSSASTARSTGSRARGSAKGGKGQPKCGDTITTDTTLHKNLVDCPNNGIVIGADKITLDLNGHLIDGDGTPTSGCENEKEFCDVGVVNERHGGVTVMHGSIC
jgi:hypothetical protein